MKDPKTLVRGWGAEESLPVTSAGATGARCCFEGSGAFEEGVLALLEQLVQRGSQAPGPLDVRVLPHERHRVVPGLVDQALVPQHPEQLQRRPATGLGLS